MYEVYVLKSKKSGIRYIGSGLSAKERLKKHNSGSNRFSKGHRPWELIYTEIFDNKTEALKREKFLKSGQGREWLDRSSLV